MSRVAQVGQEPPSDVEDLDLARNDLARRLYESPRDARAWALLADVERRRGEIGAARLCAEAAASLDPGDARVRLARAAVLVCSREELDRGREELRELARATGPGGDVGRRAWALLRAVGE